ncbi:MAG TPA: TetR/AcrR family transcriptional regulator [Thermodesulfobacteriota bacterium]|nr:TetR/AcrR family transcriptional regulator [Thermodesulfobacteriota bacterium]
MSKKIATKQAILQAAIEVFSKGGFRNSSISEIARRANVAEGSIYRYYKNKEDLFFSIPIQKTIEFTGEIDLHLQGIRGTFNQIRKFIWYYLYFFKTNPEYGRILMLEMRVSRSFVKTKTYNFLKKSISQILQIIEEGQNEGTIRKDVNIYILRELVLGILEHVVTRWLLQEGKYDLMEYYEDITKSVIDGIGLPRKA